ncbi:MAG: TIGR02186 family protein [Methyloligellaceae bacterium]
MLAMILGLSLSAAASAQQDTDGNGASVETDISAREIAIESNFTGARLVVFGSVLKRRGAREDSARYDLVVVVRGPERPVVARQKSRILGIWVNAKSREYQNVPGYYAVLSNRPLWEIAPPDILNKYGIGFESILREHRELGDPRDPFRDAIIRINEKEGLFRRSEEGARFVGKSLFRATVDLPANVPIGEYWTDVFVFSKGKLVSENSTSLIIHKQGFERFVFTAAFDYPLLYGIAAVIIAMLSGLLASAVFRKD